VHFCVQLQLPVRPQNILLIDIEVSDGLIAIFGYYSMGAPGLHQLIFPEPILPSELLALPEVRTILENHSQYAIYNVGFEAGILQLPRARCIELMPYPKCPKERFIQIEGLSKIAAAHLPDCTIANIPLIAKHNLSCLIKELILFLFRPLFTSPRWTQDYLELIAHGIG
jgi:hypothetical protein